MSLSAGRFGEFFAALWGDAPFPWQERLVREVVDGAGWPAVLDLPTGSGKTAALDVAAFAMAVDAQRPADERRHPRRVALVIDRRLVVDQGYRRAWEISEAIATAETGILDEVRRSLQGLRWSGATGRPLMAAILRGGMVREDDWARTPDQPLLLVSTVDQVGSRLLFRGYGVSARMAPVHAGLIGNDTLFLLDEVHLSQPFEQTLEQVARYGVSPLVGTTPSRPLQVVRMSATPGTTVATPFRLDAADRRHPVLQRRLAVSKPAVLVELAGVPADPEKACKKIAANCLQRARPLLESGEHRTVAVIVNRVDTAILAGQEACDAKWIERLGVDVAVVTGRMRPLDRRAFERDVIARVAHRAGGSADGRPLLLISTQAIEAGADFDFDALVTELASLDALRQRFGRLNRSGRERRSPAVILAADRALQADAEDPVYGASLLPTWRWLSNHATDGVVDFGIDALDAVLAATGAEEHAAMLAPKPSAPALLPAYLDMWSQTSPAPAVEPDLGVFLHGPERDPADVQIVWRADLSEELLARDLPEVVARLMACPPSSLESVAVPLWAARAWLARVRERGRDSERPGRLFPVTDVEGEAAPALSDAQQREEAGRATALAAAWAGQDTRVVGGRDDLRPGMTLVVPATYGGLWAGNWDPRQAAAVVDLGDEAQLVHRRRAVLRWDPAVVAGWAGEDAPVLDAETLAAAVEEDGEEALAAAFEAWVDELLQRPQPPWAQAVLTWLRERRHRQPILIGHDWYAAASRGRVEAEHLDAGDDVAPGEAWTEETGSFNGVRAVALREHLGGVRDVARAMAEHAGLAPALVEDVALAGWLHDTGKADERFQVLLHGGDPVAAAVAKEPLAKSAVPAAAVASRRRAHEVAGYPPGTRHEMMSLALVQSDQSLRARAHDWDLVLHLVASHHGYCRPWPPVEPASGPVEVMLELDGTVLRGPSDHSLARIDSGIVERFWSLTKRYGWHGLAFLEAVVRLADHRRSEMETAHG